MLLLVEVPKVGVVVNFGHGERAPQRFFLTAFLLTQPTVLLGRLSSGTR